MLHVHRQQGSEQRRQHAPHVADVLQNLSVRGSNATSCNSPATWRESLTLLDPATWWTKWSEVTYEVIDFHDIQAYEAEKRSADAKGPTGSTKDPHQTDT